MARPSFGGNRGGFGGGMNRGGFGGMNRGGYGGMNRGSSYGAMNRGGYGAGMNRGASGGRGYGASSRNVGGFHSFGVAGSRTSGRGVYASRAGGAARGGGAGGHSASALASARGGAAGRGGGTGGAHAAATRATRTAAASARPPRASNGQTYSGAGGSQASFAAGPYAFPAGYSYTAFAVGAFLPAVFWQPQWFVLDWGYYGLWAPPPDAAWIRYGPDLLLIELDTGAILRVVRGVYVQGGYADPDALAGDPPPPGS
jgi:Ni/Co efflux regulator RcnB